jgi:hypothetical protein
VRRPQYLPPGLHPECVGHQSEGSYIRMSRLAIATKPSSSLISVGSASRNCTFDIPWPSARALSRTIAAAARSMPTTAPVEPTSSPTQAVPHHHFHNPHQAAGRVVITSAPRMSPAFPRHRSSSNSPVSYARRQNRLILDQAWVESVGSQEGYKRSGEHSRNEECDERVAI